MKVGTGRNYGRKWHDHAYSLDILHPYHRHHLGDGVRRASAGSWVGNPPRSVSARRAVPEPHASEVAEATGTAVTRRGGLHLRTRRVKFFIQNYNLTPVDRNDVMPAERPRHCGEVGSSMEDLSRCLCYGFCLRLRWSPASSSSGRTFSVSGRSSKPPVRSRTSSSLSTPPPSTGSSASP